MTSPERIIEVSLNQGDKSKVERKETVPLGTKDDLCAKAAPPRHASSRRGSVFVTICKVGDMEVFPQTLSGVHLISMWLVGMHPMGVYLMGVRLIDVWLYGLVYVFKSKKVWGKPLDPLPYKRWLICRGVSCKIRNPRGVAGDLGLQNPLPAPAVSISHTVGTHTLHVPD